MTFLNDEDFKASGLHDTAWYQRLVQDAPSFVDVGARFGAQGYIAPFKKICRFTGFDADPAALDSMSDEAQQWHSAELLPYCVWSSCGEVKLNITESPMNCSVLPPAKAFVERYGSRGFAIEKQVSMDAISLDELKKRYDYRFGEVLKLDTQGAELNILHGGPELLKDHVEVVVSEVQFLPAYEGTPVFSDIESHLRKQGFTFYGLLDHNFRSTKAMNKKKSLQRERFFHADAVFFRDKHKAQSARSFDIQIMMALALAYYDFALELAKAANWPDEEFVSFQQAVNRLSEAAAQSLLAHFNQLKSQSDLTLPQVMRYVDSLRDYTTYADAV